MALLKLSTIDDFCLLCYLGVRMTLAKDKPLELDVAEGAIDTSADAWLWTLLPLLGLNILGGGF